MSAVFHLFAILVKVVEPEDMRTWRTRFSKAFRPSSSTRRKACEEGRERRAEEGRLSTMNTVSSVQW